MTISVEQIKTLRDKTGAGMVDVKKALEEAGGDMTQAADALRKKGITKAAKRGDKVAAEGIIMAETGQDGAAGYMLELNSETDFVARNEQFQKLAADIFELVKSKQPADIDSLLNLALADSTVKEKLESLSGVIGEKLAVNNVAVVKNTGGTVASYVHGEGRIGVLVSLTGGSPALARDIAMQVAASNPRYLKPEDVPAEDTEKEKVIYREQLAAVSKPAEMMEKIIQGKLGKFYEEICLVKQLYIKDDKKTVEQVLKEAGENVSIEKFVRFALA